MMQATEPPTYGSLMRIREEFPAASVLGKIAETLDNVETRSKPVLTVCGRETLFDTVIWTSKIGVS